MVTLFTTAILLLVSFDIALCQRKVSRNVAVGGSEVKTVVNFNCPEEFGYYPHPNDCTQYYVCVFGGALLESCTGGLMYSHELQTCDWPRNVGCDGTELQGPVTSPSPPSRSREEPRTRYTPPTPPPPQPAAIVTSRGQPRQLHHNQQEIIKQRQQQQLYADAEETLPPAEEVESDRQQRVYRGQPSSVGQVQKDRDGLRHSNAITNYSGRNDRIGVISFGTQQQQYSKLNDVLTNDLTVKRRRKRQTQRSRVRSIETWRGGQQNVKSSRLNSYTLQPPPMQAPIYSPSFQRSNFVPSPLSDGEFKPFVPNYQRLPTHTIAKKEPFVTDYFITTFRPPITNKVKHTSDYKMLPQHTHVIHHNTSAVQITNPNILSVGTTTGPTYSETSKDEESVDYKSEYPEFNEYFGPPSSYFNPKNKYENVVNPFANPQFDFDKFLLNLRDDPFEPKSETKPESKVNPTKILPIKVEDSKPKTSLISENTSDDDDNDDESQTERKRRPVATLGPITKSKPKNRNPVRIVEVNPKQVILNYEEDESTPESALRASTRSQPKNLSPVRVTGLKPKPTVSLEGVRLVKPDYDDDEDEHSGSTLRPLTRSKPKNTNPVGTLLFRPKTTVLPENIRLNKYDYEDLPITGPPLRPSTKFKPSPNPVRESKLQKKTTISPDDIRLNKYDYENDEDRPNPGPALRPSIKSRPNNLNPITAKTPVLHEEVHLNKYDYENDEDRPNPDRVLRPSIKSRPNNLNPITAKTPVLHEEVLLNKYDYENDEDRPNPGPLLRPSIKSRPNNLYPITAKTAVLQEDVLLNKHEYDDDDEDTPNPGPALKPSIKSRPNNLNPITAKSPVLHENVRLNKYYYDDDDDSPNTESVLKISTKSKPKNISPITELKPKTTILPENIRFNKYDYEDDEDKPKPGSTLRPIVKSKAENFNPERVVRLKPKTTVQPENIRLNNYDFEDDDDDRPKTKSNVRPLNKLKPKNLTPVRIFESETKAAIQPEIMKSNDNSEEKKGHLEYKPKPSVTPKTKTTIRPTEYYYDEEESEDNSKGRYETKETPRKIYSSQIKPTGKVDDEYYYEEEYDYPGKNIAKPSNITKNGDLKYSAKYHGKPLKLSKITTNPQTPLVYPTTTPRLAHKDFLTSETFIPYVSTTQKPKLTTRPRTKLTLPTTTRPSRTKQRQRLDDDLRQRVEQSSAAPVHSPVSTATATARALYNSSQYNNNNYDPYYALYDDDVELYRDVDYSQQQQYNNNNPAQSQTAPQSYRRTPTPVIQSTQEEPPKRGSASYIQNNYNSQDIYQPATGSDYNDDNSYNSQVDDQYRQINRQPVRGDRNDLNYLEEPTTKRITTTTTRKTTTRTTTSRTYPPKKSSLPRLPVTANETKTQAQSIINTLGENPGPIPLTPHTIIPKHNSTLGLDEITTSQPKPPDTSSKILLEAVVHKPSPFTEPERLTTEKPIVFHYITKSRSTTLVSTEVPKTSAADESFIKKTTVIVPTTYSPPKFFLKSLLPKSAITDSTTIHYLSHTKLDNRPYKSLKSVRKLISPINVNYGLSSVTGSSFDSVEKSSSEEENEKHILPEDTKQNYDSTTKLSTSSTSTEVQPSSSESVTYIKKGVNDYYYTDDELNDYNESKLKHYIEPYTNSSGAKRFRTTIEIPPPYDLIDNTDEEKPEPDQSPDYKLQPFPKPTTTTTIKTTTTTTDSPHNTSIPVRTSRVNAAIKSQTAFGGTRRQNVKCHESAESKCNDPKRQRTSTRGRGSTHYSNGGNIVNNEVTVPVNRGTPASRPRPTLKPSTSIVSKASEFIDIYRYPPIRPQPIYPQPQPDKTAAKCRKDVCLLPDCSCGGKEIPGDLPVEQVPQIVLLTFDDSVNDLNKGLYSDLFEKGRVNPNGCPISATFYVSHEWTDYSQVQNLYSDGHEIASHTVSHSFGEQFSQKKWTREVAGQREILAAYGGVHLEDVRGMRAPFLSVGGNKMFKMLYDSNFTYDSSMPIYENKPPSWPYTLDYKLFHDCMIPPCPTRSYPGVWEVPMVMWQDLNGGRCSMGDACSNPPDSEGVFKMLTKNFQRHYTSNRAPFGLFYHAAWFTQPHHKEGFINFLDSILQMKDVWLLTNWQAIQWVRDPTPVSRLGSFQPFQCDYVNRPKRCNNPKVCNLWHKSGVRYMRTCQPCPDIYPWTGNTGIRSSRIDNDIED